MRQLFSIFIALSLLTCSLLSLQVVRCVEQSDGSGARVECARNTDCAAAPACTAERDCGTSDPGESDGGQNTDDAAACCFLCSPNCCCYLLPTVGFQLRAFAEEAIEKPQGLQHRYPQSFLRSVWHPPAGKA